MKRKKKPRDELHDFVNYIADSYYCTRKMFEKLDKLIDKVIEEEI